MNPNWNHGSINSNGAHLDKFLNRVVLRDGSNIERDTLKTGPCSLLTLLEYFTVNKNFQDAVRAKIATLIKDTNQFTLDKYRVITNFPHIIEHLKNGLQNKKFRKFVFYGNNDTSYILNSSSRKSPNKQETSRTKKIFNIINIIKNYFGSTDVKILFPDTDTELIKIIPMITNMIHQSIDIIDNTDDNTDDDTDVNTQTIVKSDAYLFTIRFSSDEYINTDATIMPIFSNTIDHGSFSNNSEKHDIVINNNDQMRFNFSFDLNYEVIEKCIPTNAVFNKYGPVGIIALLLLHYNWKDIILYQSLLDKLIITFAREITKNYLNEPIIQQMIVHHNLIMNICYYKETKVLCRILNVYKNHEKIRNLLDKIKNNIARVINDCNVRLWLLKQNLPYTLQVLLFNEYDDANGNIFKYDLQGNMVRFVKYDLINGNRYFLCENIFSNESTMEINYYYDDELELMNIDRKNISDNHESC